MSDPTPGDETLHVRLMLEATRGDPVQRFIQGLRDEGLQRHCRETLALRRELHDHQRAADLEGDYQKALAHAQWGHQHIREITWPWCALRKCIERFAEMDVRHTRHQGPT